MRVITLNANGIRSAARKGFFQWVAQQDADVICLQETKAQEHQLGVDVACPSGYQACYFDAQKKGYSGVALYYKRLPDRIVKGLGWPDMDAEARYLQADYGSLSVVSLYLPSGTSGPERQAVKYRFMDGFYEILRAMSEAGRSYVICGDWNIAHKPIDLKNWRANQKNSGFLPEERAWMDKVFDGLGMVDAFRVVSQEPEQYTWWSNRGRSWEKNVGWRIDYQVVTPDLKGRIKSAEIYKAERFSDHAPLTMDYDWEL